MHLHNLHGSIRGKITLKDIAEDTRIKLFYARIEAKNKIDQDSNSRLSDL
jgi:hypothetical protein